MSFANSAQHHGQGLEGPSGFLVGHHTPIASEQTQEFSRTMDDAMNQNDLVFNGVKDEVVLNNEEPISHCGQLFFIGYLTYEGVGGEIG